MHKKVFLNAGLLALVAIILTFGIALAHTTIHAGNYEIEVGWQDEPAVIGQRNALVLNVSDTTAPDHVVDISKLLISITYGGQTKALNLEPLGEDTTNQYLAAILPTVPGKYTVQLRGKLGDTDVNLDVDPEEVGPVESLAFPVVSTGQAQGSGGLQLADWLAAAALLVSLAALGLAFLAFRKSR